jgi:hypothetical protein
MTIGESSSKRNRGTINALIAIIAFCVWILFFHSTSCNGNAFKLQAWQRWTHKTSHKIDSFSFETISNSENAFSFEMISKCRKSTFDKISHINNEESLILQLSNNSPVFEQLFVPNYGPVNFDK